MPRRNPGSLAAGPLHERNDQGLSAGEADAKVTPRWVPWPLIHPFASICIHLHPSASILTLWSGVIRFGLSRTRVRATVHVIGGFCVYSSIATKLLVNDFAMRAVAGDPLHVR